VLLVALAVAALAVPVTETVRALASPGARYSRTANAYSAVADGHAARHLDRQFALHAANGDAHDQFGSAVAVSGQVVVVGAPSRTVDGHAGQGAVYVFVRPASGWAQARATTMLTLAHGHRNDRFGSAVAISGDTIVVGAPLVSQGAGHHQGAAYVFAKGRRGWAAVHHPTGMLAPTDGAAEDLLGAAVAVAGRNVVVGAPGHVVGQHPGQGAAYVFSRPASGWSTLDRPAGELTSSNGSAYDYAGFSVAIAGKTVVAGAPYRRVEGHRNAGAAYVFVESPLGWAATTETGQLTERAARPSDYFAKAVAISGHTIAVGDPGRRIGHTAHQGATDVFVRPAGGWSAARHQDARLVASPGVRNAYLGAAVTVGRSRIAATGYGFASLFQRPTHGWTGRRHQAAELTGSGPADYLGSALATSGRILVAGAPTQQVGSHADQGVVYLYLR
jgi:hypothetical protein